MIHSDFLLGKCRICLFGIEHHTERTTEGAKLVIELSPDINVREEHLDFLCIFFVFDRHKEIAKVRISLAQTAHTCHNVNDYTLNVSTIEILKTCTTIDFHSRVKFLNKSSVVND